MVSLILQIFLLEIKEILFGNVTIEKGVSSQIDAVLEEDASFFVEKTKSSQVIQNVTFSESLEAPIEKGYVIGKVTYSIDNKVVKTVNIVASDTVKKINLVNMSTNLYDNWFNLLRKYYKSPFLQGFYFFFNISLHFM